MIYKILAEYIQDNILGCRFVGIEEDTGELFMSFTHEDDKKKKDAAKQLLARFDEVKKIAIVEQVDIKKATQMVDDLNKILAEKDKSDLLKIEKF